MRLERLIAIESACQLCIDTGRLSIARDGVISYVALPDLGTLILDTTEVQLTGGVIRTLAENDIPIIVTDTKHNTAGILMPAVPHIATASRQRKQALTKINFNDAMWAITISAKIYNQAKFLSARGYDKPLVRLNRLAESVMPGDPRNHEAQAARLYWPEIFGRHFKRSKEGASDSQNSALNYGYAILRGLVSRHIALAGLSPVFGYGHANDENPYCLIDDLIEPYRPCVDALVATEIKNDMVFDSNAKRIMLKLLLCEANLDEQRYRLHTAVGFTIQSYCRALESEDANKLSFPNGFTLPL